MTNLVTPYCTTLFQKEKGDTSEASTGLEPVNRGFAIHCLANLATTPNKDQEDYNNQFCSVKGGLCTNTDSEISGRRSLGEEKGNLQYCIFYYFAVKLDWMEVSGRCSLRFWYMSFERGSDGKVFAGVGYGGLFCRLFFESGR